MKRSTWLAVAGACILLVAAGSLPHLPAERAAEGVRTLLARATSLRPPPPATGRAAERAPAGPDVPPARREASRPAHAGPLPYAVAGALAGVALLAALARGVSLARGDRRVRVHRLARAGRPASWIAREARLERDGVRTLLAPGAGPVRR